ncbi:helix-turn-helix domain-containing protein [Paenibacillus harenae]|uniref:AraC-like DNA-binding protein n=1 Tax=Paenibacillus harenae TaxID=306543 RepID=A0ABT9U958_PAEHA|nr:AraC family transcriptional regulator [Paenibacillus harenae]MDQ0059046.1 AraC-like DNA-binding protein [Paenibacillus harenae]MDQ0115541.1 AraC-like DNA-binding protein [Paenibacillus harenae]
MTDPLLPGSLTFGTINDPLWIEFDRRIGYHSMNNSHYHMAYEVYYLFSGERNFFIRDSVYHVHPGDLVLIGSNAVHKTTERSTPNHERVVLHIEQAYLSELSSEDKDLLFAPFAADHPVVKLNLKERMHVEQLLGSLLRELSECPPGYRLHIRNMTIELLLFIARHFLKRKAMPDIELTPVQRKVTDITRHINLHFREPLQLDDLAKQFFISKGHLCRVFKEVTGFGFTQYINVTRVKEAEYLLRETDWSVTQVSEQCGFENFSHFGKVFKKLSGLSPRAYRKLQQSRS